MRRSLWPVLGGLLLAILAAAFVAMTTGLPFADRRDGETSLWHFLRTLFPIAAYALPGALAAIALTEARRVRGLSFHLFAGALIAVLGFMTLTRYGLPTRDAFLSKPAFMRIMIMGLLAGFSYWLIAGRHAGHLAAAFARSSDGSVDEKGARRRCRSCAALGLLLGLLPLALIGWCAIYNQTPMTAPAITAKAETDAAGLLTAAGLTSTGLRIENYVGHVTGNAPDATARNAAFDKAKTVLAPMVGLPGVVAYLQNDIASPDLLGSPEWAAAEKRKADAEAAAKAKAAEEAKAAQAAEAARIAAEAEAKRKADEAVAKSKADEEARLAAEADAKRKADEAAAEVQRKADEVAAAKVKANEDARAAAEADAERKAVEAAHRAAAAAELANPAAVAVTPPVAPASPAPVTPPASQQCAGNFSDLFRSAAIRYAIGSAEAGAESAGVLDAIAGLAKRCPSIALTIDGHSDRSGADDYNTNLALDRAQTVREALIARGIDGNRLVASGYGAERPFDPANTRAAFALNRRVDFGTKAYAPAPKVETVATAKPEPAPLAPGQCGPEFSRLFFSDAVRFIGSSAELDDSHAEFLDKIADVAVRCPAFTINLDGHTDRRGNAVYNQTLSQARADAVREALIDRDVPDGRLVARGYAGERPYDPGNTPAAFALNRRVDFGVAEKQTKSP